MDQLDGLLDIVEPVLPRSKEDDEKLKETFLSILEKLEPERRAQQRYTFLYDHLTAIKGDKNAQFNKLLQPHFYHLNKLRQLDELSASFAECQKKLKTELDSGHQNRALLTDELTETENILVNLYRSYGSMCKNLANHSRLAPVSADMIGEFNQSFGILNSILGQIRESVTGDKYTHILSKDQFSNEDNRNFWPTKADLFTTNQLLEGRNINDIDLTSAEFGDQNEPLTLEAPVAPGSETQVEKHPKMVVFKCNVGHGHISATKALAQSFPECDFQVADIYDDVLKSLDIGKKIDPSLSEENLANYIAKQELNQLMNFLENFTYMHVNQDRLDRIEKIVERYVRMEKPDILISVIPVLNSAFINVGKKLGIPVRVVTTDVGIRNFTRNITKEHCEYEHFGMTFAYDMQNSRNLLDESVIGKNYPKELLSKITDNVGYPVRSAFNRQIDPKELDKLRKEYDIQDDENVVLVMMGGNAAPAAKDYAKLLSQMTDDQLDKIRR